MISEKRLEIIFVVFLVILSFYYMYLSFGTNMLGEDEAYYYSLAKDFFQGKFDIFDVTGVPVVPQAIFMPLLYSFFFLIGGPLLGITKFISALFGFLTLVVVYLIGKKFNILYGLFSAILLFSISMFVHFMMIAYIEIPIAFFSVLSVYLFLTLDSLKKALFTGIILGIAFYTKSSALLFVGILILYMLFLFFYRKNKNYLKIAILTLITFALTITPFVVRNLTLYNYPYVQGLNSLFKPYVLEKFDSGWLIELFKLVSPVRPSLQTYTSTFGWLVFALSLFGFSWLLLNWKENKKESNLLLLLFLFIIIFVLSFNFIYYIGFIRLETRYFSIIFPQVVLLGGFFLWKMKEWNKWLLLIILPILLFSVWSSVTVVQATASSQRYPDDYVEALTWVKKNTPEDALIFTTYWGSLKYYGERDSIWSNIKGFPEMMTTNNGTFIYNILKQYNISYILIWRNTMAQDYVIPESNLWGVFTYNFANVVSTDTEHFDNVFSNQNNWIFKLL